MSHRITRRARAAIIAAAVTTAALTLGACSAPASDVPETTGATASDEPGDPALAALGLEDADARTLIDTLDALPLDERPTDLMASIRPDEVLVTTESGETSIPMPEDAFYVSFAPYVDSTHDCYFHSLTTCTGELGDEEVQVLVTDAATGEVLIDETRTTFANGFVGLWLPRDIQATLTVTYDGLTATQELSTANADDATCVTTMQLA
ncbi:CueP family metal-binding protein [Demequina sp. NBRC 110052]|uniref:CueP family metal-binding protein n=1 Tax=Demequina sp. NBRC 110052 TaxID=1570341 RepID=UPI000A00F553|nr:CueP family metal-binding protein [Demequina sp. NBRC 110052]